MSYKFEVTVNGTVQKYTVENDGAKAAIIKLEKSNKNTTLIKVNGKTVFKR